jgi:hypothetical protein
LTGVVELVGLRADLSAVDQCSETVPEGSADPHGIASGRRQPDLRSNDSGAGRVYKLPAGGSGPGRGMIDARKCEHGLRVP